MDVLREDVLFLNEGSGPVPVGRSRVDEEGLDELCDASRPASIASCGDLWRLWWSPLISAGFTNFRLVTKIKTKLTTLRLDPSLISLYV